MLACNSSLMELSGIRDWSYVYPKRPQKESCDSVNDDKLNYIMLLVENLEILHIPPFRGRYTPDGAMFRTLVVRAHDYSTLFVTGNEAHFTLRNEVSDGVRGVLLSIIALLREFTEEGRLVDGGLAAFREAELCLFSPVRPQLETLVNSSWARTVLDGQFPA